MLGWWNIFDCSGGGRGCGEFLSGMECFSSAVFQFSCVAFSGESRVEGVCLLFFCFFFFLLFRSIFMKLREEMEVGRKVVVLVIGMGCSVMRFDD